MTGQGGWPLNAFLTPERRRSTPAPTSRPSPATGLPSWRMVLDGVAEAWANRRDQILDRARGCVEALGATARLEPSVEPITRALVRDAVDACAGTMTASTAASGGRRNSPGIGDRVAARARRARDVARRRSGDGARRDLRPGRRRLRALLGRRDLDRAALREDALRQRAAGARVPARLAGVGRRALPRASAARRSTGRCGRCAAPRAASPRRSTPTPRASRGSSTSGRRRAARRRWAARRRRDRVLRRERARQLRGRAERARGARARADRAARDPRAAVAARARRVAPGSTTSA